MFALRSRATPRLLILAAFVSGIVLAARVPDAASATSGQKILYTNPVFTKPFPDPMVLRLGRHDYYAYGTSLPWNAGFFPILHSTDLVHWRNVGDAFTTAPSWSTGDLWAPDVVRRGRTYYLYYTGRGIRGHCIGVATARRPTGPFKHRNVIGCADATGLGFIDPDLYIDRDGKAYLYVSVDDPDHVIGVLPISRDLLHKAGTSRSLFGVSQGWEHGAKFTTVEGPFLIRHGALYYLFYSGNDTWGNYAMGYATSTSPTGPFTKYLRNPVLRGNRRVSGPGGGSVVEGPDGKLWMVYHAWASANRGDIDRRTMRIDPLVWHGDSVTIAVHPR